MKFGITQFSQSQSGESTADAFNRIVEVCQFAEELGFDHFMTGEQHFTPYLLNPDSLQFFSYLAAKTTRIRFCPGVIVLPLHHPIQFAERVALLDTMSGGRFDVGIGRGYQRRAYDGFAIAMDDSTARFDEYLDIAKKAWGDEPFEYMGSYYSTVNPIEVFPKPVQQPHPPIWVAGVSFHSLEKIGSQNYGFLKGPLDNFEICKSQAATYRNARRKAGLDESGDRVRMDRMTVVLDDSAEAHRVADELLQRFTTLFQGATAKQLPGKSYDHYRTDQYLRDRGLSGDYDYEHQRSFSIFGDVDAAIEQIGRLGEEVGVTEINFALGFGGMSTELSRRIMRTLAEKVIPNFR